MHVLANWGVGVVISELVALSTDAVAGPRPRKHDHDGHSDCGTAA